MNQIKLQDHILSIRAYTKSLLEEVDKIEAMFEVKEKPVKVADPPSNFTVEEMYQY